MRSFDVDLVLCMSTLNGQLPAAIVLRDIKYWLVENNLFFDKLFEEVLKELLQICE